MYVYTTPQEIYTQVAGVYLVYDNIIASHTHTHTHTLTDTHTRHTTAEASSLAQEIPISDSEDTEYRAKTMQRCQIGNY